MAEEKQDGQKTVVAFVVGLLIGGMLVWAFSGPTAGAPTPNDEEGSQVTGGEEAEADESTDESGDTNVPEANGKGGETKPAPELKVGNGNVKVPDQEASASIVLNSATYPISEGWIGVRSYNDDKLGTILGVARFSESQGLVPSEIELLISTKPGNRYAIVIFSEDGDRVFSLANDIQIDQIFDTFVAQ